MNLLPEDIEFIRAIITQKNVSLYHFHEKYMLSPAQLAKTIKKFESIDIVKMSNQYAIKLTVFGRKWIIKNRKLIFLSEKDKYWKIIPEYMLCNSIEINQTYKPNDKISNYIIKKYGGR